MRYPYLYTDEVHKHFTIKAGKLSGSTPQVSEFFIYPDVLDFENPASIAAFIGRTRILGQPTVEIPVNGKLVVSQRLVERFRKAITRTKQFFGFAGGPGLMLVDCDMKHASARYRPLSELGLPGDILRVEYPSSSSWIYADNQWLSQGSGQHVVIAVDDVREIPAITEALYLRSWLAGCGYILQAKNAALLDRSFIDKSVGSAERFVYGAPVLARGLARPELYGQVCGWRPLRLFEVELDPVERERAAKTIQQALDQARTTPEYLAVRRDYASRTRAPGESLEAALLRVDRMAQIGQLPPYHVITTCDGPKTVRDIYNDFDRYYGTECADPLEPGYGNDERIALFVRLAGMAPAIYSHAHGGQEWLLMPAVIESGGVIDSRPYTIRDRLLT